MTPDQLAIMFAGIAAFLGIAAALIVWLMSSGAIKDLQNKLRVQEEFNNAVRERDGEFNVALERIHGELASSCEFLRGEVGSTDKTLRNTLNDTLVREEETRKLLASQIENLQEDLQNKYNTTLQTLQEFSESEQEMMQYVQHKITELGDQISETTRDLTAAITARERESLARDQELGRTVSEIDDRLGNTITTRYKQLTESLHKLEELTKQTLLQEISGMQERLTTFVTDTERIMGNLRQEIGQEIGETRAYIDDSLRERRRDLMA